MMEKMKKRKIKKLIDNTIIAIKIINISSKIVTQLNGNLNPKDPIQAHSNFLP